MIAERYFGAFGVKDGKVFPLIKRTDFAPEYRNVSMTDAVRSMLGILHAEGGGVPR